MANIEITFDASAQSAPQSFRDSVQAVASYLDANLANPAPVFISVGYGEVNGQQLSGGAIGESFPMFGLYNWSQISAALRAANPTFQLPATDPTLGQTFYTFTATARALGLNTVIGTNPLDGYIGLSQATDYDVYTVAAHEISEVMGRVLMCENISGAAAGAAPNFITPYDLFNFTAPGVRSYFGPDNRYFSIDNGVTPINTFNSQAGADWGDWRGDTNDPFNAFYSGSEVISPADWMFFRCMGWMNAGTAPPPPSPSPLPTGTFSASPSSLRGPGNVTLNWTTSGATSASIDNGIGPVAIGSGSRVIPVSQTTTFTLSMVNSAGPSSLSATVTEHTKLPHPHKMRFGQKYPSRK